VAAGVRAATKKNKDIALERDRWSGQADTGHYQKHRKPFASLQQYYM
jgi:hypothetical protein